MFSIATFLDSAKAGAGIDSDYRLAKVIGITHAAISSYRRGKSLPNEGILQQLCALSGDDPDIVAAQVQAARAQSDEGRSLWERVALRLASDRRATIRTVSTAILSVLFTIGMIAAPADSARASGLDHQKTVAVNLLYIV